MESFEVNRMKEREKAHILQGMADETGQSIHELRSQQARRAHDFTQSRFSKYARMILQQIMKVMMMMIFKILMKLQGFLHHRNTQNYQPPKEWLRDPTKTTQMTASPFSWQGLVMDPELQDKTEQHKHWCQALDDYIESLRSYTNPRGKPKQYHPQIRARMEHRKQCCQALANHIGRLL